MGNTFGQPYLQGTQAAVTVPLYDPREIRRRRRVLLRQDVPELRYANSFYQPSGRWPARGWILLLRSDYNQFGNLFLTTFQLQLDDFASGPLTLKNLAVVQARCVSRGTAADPNAVYLVELTDRQGVLYNPWGSFPTNSQYNVRSPAYPQQYDSASTNAGSAWTWDAMAGDLWQQMPLMGTYPHLPSPSPAGTPENWIFPGTSCWAALNSVLDYLGMTVSCDLRQANPYGIVIPGAADATYSALVAKYSGQLEDSWEYIDSGSGRIPGQVTVYFHRRNQYYGTEETVRNDSLQWSTTPLYQVMVSATTAGFPQYASAAGTAYLWSDFTVQYDVDSQPLASDVATAQSVAISWATSYYNRQIRSGAGSSHLVYTGALPFAAGSQVDGVRWYMDYSHGRGGWRTEVVRGPQPPWPEVLVEPFGRQDGR